MRMTTVPFIFPRAYNIFHANLVLDQKLMVEV